MRDRERQRDRETETQRHRDTETERVVSSIFQKESFLYRIRELQ